MRCCNLANINLFGFTSSLTVCTFSSRSDTEWYVVVGTAKNLTLSPRSYSGGSLVLFRFSSDFTKFEHVHTVMLLAHYFNASSDLSLQTPLNDVPVAMAPFQGRLLVGVGKTLRIYDIGRKKMLRKCENKNLPNLIVDIQSLGGRVYVSDVQEAVHFIRYKPVENQLVIFADETYQRFDFIDMNMFSACNTGL